VTLTLVGVASLQGGAGGLPRADGRTEGSGGGAGRVLAGVVEGNGTPRGDYRVHLYASHVVGRQRVTLLGSDMTDLDGRFSIPFRMPPRPERLGPVLYAVAEQGQSMLASAIGDASLHDDVVINERTTVAIGSSFAQFVDGVAITGNPYGMVNAAMMAGNMADPETGLVGSVLDNPPNGGGTSTRATFNTLANIVAACVADEVDCHTLFEQATPAGEPPATSVLQAIAYLTRYPANDVDGPFALGAGGPFAPALDQSPTSWLLFLKFTGGMYSEYDTTNLMSRPGNVAFDEQGFAWINDNYVPTKELHVGCAGLRLMKFYPWGESYPGSPYFGGGLSGAGFGITLDPRGDVWVGNFGFEAPVCNGVVPPDPANKIPATHDSVSQFRPDGTPVSPSEGATGGDIWWPQATVSDAKGNIWTANCGNDTVTIIPKGNSSRARNVPLPGGQGAANNLAPVYPEEPSIKPFAIAIDPHGRAWVTGNRADEVYIVDRDGSVEIVDSNGLLSWPMGISTDSAGNMWVSNSDAVNVPCVTPLDRMEGADPAVVLFPADGSAPSKHVGGGLSIPWGNAVDGSDTLWVFNFGRNPTVDVDAQTVWPDTGVSHFCGVDTSTCPDGVGPGEPISPPETGYASDALDRITGGGVDPSGNLWLMNNWKKNGPLPPVYNTNPGGNSFVIVPGAATPIQTPLIGPPVPFGAG
jgi:hypothetical protein